MKRKQIPFDGCMNGKKSTKYFPICKNVSGHK